MPVAFGQLSPYTLYGVNPGPASNAVETTPEQAAPLARRGLLDPSNPLFWFGVVLAATFGLAAVTGSVRLGPAQVSAKVGKG